METLKNITKKQGIIIASVVVGLIVLITGFVLITNKDNIDNQNPINDKKAFGTLNFEYGAEIEDDKFAIMRNDKEVIVQVKDIDTMKIGKTEYTANTDKGLKTIIADVTDTQSPVIKGEDVLEIELQEDMDLSAFLNEELKASDPVDGELSLEFKYEEITKPGQYKVQAIAKDANGNITVKDIVLNVKEAEEIPVEKEETEKPVVDNGNTDDNNNSGGKPSAPLDVPNYTTPSGATSDVGAAPGYDETSNDSKPASSPKEETPVIAPKPSKPSMGVPSGLPSGSVLVDEDSPIKFQDYSYSQTLSDGSKVSGFYTQDSRGFKVGIQGLDSKGNSFLASVYPTNKEELNFSFSMPTMSSEAMSELISLADTVFTAYGK